SLCADTLGQEDQKPQDNNCVPIRGGLYPAPLPTGTGLCTRTIQQSDYLCRPPNADRCTDTAGEDEPNVIKLMHCKASAPPRDTVSGPDACLNPYWTASTKNFDPQTQCNVQLRCAPCKGGTPGCTSGVTTMKDRDGNIQVTVAESPEGPATYIFLHEL